MKTKNIRLIIIMSIIAILAVIVNQFYLVLNSLEIQSATIEIQKKNYEIEREQFDNQVLLALVGVRDELVSLNSDAKGIYLDPVKQIAKNYFVVSFYDTLNPQVLENLLVNHFETYNVTEPFEYGIYDCYIDSIIFDKYVDLSKKEVVKTEHKVPQEKWEHDGHYFGVYFPYKQDRLVDEKADLSSMYVWSSILIFVVMSIFLMTIFTILKQKRLSEVKTDFINNMTHELKTPIATIALSSDVLKRGDIDSERLSRYAHIISTENARLESQVERVLQLAKLESGKIYLKKELFDVHEVIRKSAQTFKLSVEQEEGTLSYELKAGTTKLYADKVHITNVLYNLLDNAVKYSPENPLIRIETDNFNNGVMIAIHDNGKGMSKEQTRQIFEKFYRVPTGSVHDVKGFGLGLFYVKEIIKAHQGKIGVTSELGKGSTFQFWLPLS
jgi:two-component system, OmpR family, phosphate regulon sensor histidine kinase PhoR